MYRLLAGFALFGFAAEAQSGSGGFSNFQERWDDYLRRTYDWKKIGAVAAESVVGQSFQPRHCGRPPYCFPHHVGRSLARRTARTTIELGAGALLREDLRRRPSGLTGFRSRVAFALLHAPLARGPSGEWRPAYSRFIGTLGAVTVSRAWDGRPMAATRMSESCGWTMVSYFQDALLTEFETDLKRFGAKTWRNHLRPLLFRAPAAALRPRRK